MEWNFEVVWGPYGGCSEGPVWDGETVLFTQMAQSMIWRYDPKTDNTVEYRRETQNTDGLTMDKRGNLYGCNQAGRSIVRFEKDGSTTTIVDSFEGKKLNTPNDLVVDSRDRIWFTNPWNSRDVGGFTAPVAGQPMELDGEEVFRADPQPDGTYSLTCLTKGCVRPDGILITPDERTLIVAQGDWEPGGVQQLRSYPINDDGSLGDHIVMHQFGEDYRGTHRSVDGMCFDTDGNIVATAGWDPSGPGSMIYVFAPSGRVLSTHPMPPDSWPTNCAFGDPDMRTLYVTTNQGHLYRVRNTGLQGWIIWP